MHLRTEALDTWRPPSAWTEIRTVDAHTEGEPLRVVVGGYPEVRGRTMLERRAYLRAHHDAYRTALMWEPRGHADMYGCVITPSVTPEAAFGVLFLHNEGYSTMCGHGIIAVVTVLVETGALDVPPEDGCVGIDTPAGLVRARPRIVEGRVASVAFENVPSFVVALGQTVDVPGVGSVRYDLAFGGAYYAFVDAGALGLPLEPSAFAMLVDRGARIKRAVAEAARVQHPLDEDLGFLYGVIFVGPAAGEAHSRNVCVFADGEVDRSPTGTGVSARLAIHHARGEIGIDEPMVVESLIGSRFTGRVRRTVTFDALPAVVPEIEGRAHITGRHRFWLDPRDVFQSGFLLR